MINKEQKLSRLPAEFPKKLSNISQGNFLHTKFIIDAILEDKFIPSKINISRLQPGLYG